MQSILDVNLPFLCGRALAQETDRARVLCLLRLLSLVMSMRPQLAWSKYNFGTLCVIAMNRCRNDGVCAYFARAVLDRVQHQYKTEDWLAEDRDIFLPQPQSDADLAMFRIRRRSLDHLGSTPPPQLFPELHQVLSKCASVVRDVALRSQAAASDPVDHWRFEYRKLAERNALAHQLSIASDDCIDFHHHLWTALHCCDIISHLVIQSK